MKKILSTFITLFFFLCAGFSQTATETLDKAANVLLKSTGSKAELVITMKNTKDGQVQVIKGNILLKKDKFKLSLGDMEVYYDGKNQWVYMPTAEEVTISAPTEEELQEINPTAIISSYKKGFQLKAEQDRVVDGKSVYVVSIHPENKNAAYHRIEILMEKNTYNIVSISTFGKDGIDTTVKVNKPQLNQNFLDSAFVFDVKKYPNVELVDLR